MHPQERIEVTVNQLRHFILYIVVAHAHDT